MAASSPMPRRRRGPRRCSPRLGAAEPAVDHGEAPLRAVHDEAYLAFLWSAHKDWRAAGREGDASGYAWPVVRRRPLALDRIDAKLGAYSFDASSPDRGGDLGGRLLVRADRAHRARRGAGGGASGLRAVPPARAIMPGATIWAAIAISTMPRSRRRRRPRPGRRVAILDVDYHHGNGTQDIFYARGDVFFASIHADPRTDYPYFWGHADETGEGEGEGATLNLPLPRGTDLAAYLPALETGAGADRRLRRGPAA